MLVGWLLFVVARLTIGDVRVPRIHAGSLQGVSGGASAISPPNGGPGESVSTSADDPDERQEPQRVNDETDVEQAVYDRLYGQRGRRG